MNMLPNILAYIDSTAYDATPRHLVMVLAV